jgi:chemotaxis regulatin CheY-phosphate phosphatase CheZ
MKKKSDILRNRLDRLSELARQAAPEDRDRLEHTIQLASQALTRVVHAQHAAWRAALLKQEAEANAVQRRTELAALLTELRIMSKRVSK